MPKVSQEKLKSWLDGSDFFAHAIWDNNVRSVLRDGSLNPAEMQFRSGKTISFEGGIYGVRISKTLDKDFGGIEQFKREQILPVENSKMSSTRAFDLHLLTYKDISRILKEKLKKIKLQDGTLYNISEDPGFPDEGDFYLEGIPVLRYGNGTPNAIEGIKKDILGELDKILAEVWKKYISLCHSNDYRAIAREIDQARSTYIPPSHLNPNIRACYNTIAWSYGSTIILGRNPAKFISILNYLKSWHESKTLAEISLTKGQEIFLLSPFENNGHPLSIDLADPDILVLAPRSVLEDKEILGELREDIQYFCIEELTPSQMESLNVPKKFQSVSQATQSKEVSPINYCFTLFSPVSDIPSERPPMSSASTYV